MLNITLVILTILLFLVEILYFKLAAHFNIVDKPNHRSSHSSITIRGGGIIFTIAMMLCPLLFRLQYALFLTGLLLVAFVSFADDLRPLSSRIRISVHIVAAMLIIAQLDLFKAPIYLILAVLLLIIATINAVNFMDGINGITGIYALVTLSTLYYLNTTLAFTNSNYLSAAIIALIVFNFFNCRKAAVCFAGDVGSVAIAFIMLFFLMQVIIKTQNLSYLFFMLLYGLDTFTTVLFRIIRNENITEAHRSHFYQFLANQKGWPHLFVAIMYGLIQLLANIVIIKIAIHQVSALVLLFLLCVVTFLSVRLIVEGKKHLLNN